MGDGLGQVPVVTLLAVVAVASCGVVTTVETHSSAPPARQLVELHVEAAAAGVQVTVAGWAQTDTQTQASTFQVK